ncbi:hypothetical protein DBP19_16450 [Streptomyces sp. CS090A]|nr:hypothetical protein DBP19_16450 [Streptomyces sp. CS090A]
MLGQVRKRALDLLVLGEDFRAETDYGQRDRGECARRDHGAAGEQLRTGRRRADQGTDAGEAAPRFLGAPADPVAEGAAHLRAGRDEPAAHVAQPAVRIPLETGESGLGPVDSPLCPGVVEVDVTDQFADGEGQGSPPTARAARYSVVVVDHRPVSRAISSGSDTTRGVLRHACANRDSEGRPDRRTRNARVDRRAMSSADRP